jgi:hypothetical protein
MSGDAEKATTPDYEVVKISDKPFSSLPLFLPNNLIYIEETNTVRPKDTSTLTSTSINGGDVEPNNVNDGSLVIVPNAGLSMLQNFNHPIATISCIGPYRTGKSLLMSRFLQSSNAFDIGPTLEGCTRGIWISTSALKDVASKTKTNKGSSGCYTFFLDAEGLGDPLQGDEASNARIALTCILLSSCLIFNNTSHPDRSSLQFLRMLHTIRQKIPQHRHFPSLCWVFRDFFLQLPKRTMIGNGDSQGGTSIGTPYTLQEFMMERVLNQTENTSMRHDPVEGDVIDSLLNDFSKLKVMSVGYPRKQDGFNMSPEEMSMLQTVDWNELDETFRNDMQDVIDHCLEHATPFQLGALGGTSTPTKDKRWHLLPQRNKSSDMMYATGVAYSKWCTTVISLVNSPDTVPNLPDLQQQLLQQMADDLLQSSLETFETDLRDWWNHACPVFNGENENEGETEMLISQNELKTVANAKELVTKSQKIYNQLLEEVYRGSISPGAILTATMKKLEQKCYKDPDTSILAQIQQENAKRSQAACSALAQHLYAPLRSSIREDPTCMSLEDFQATLQQLTESFKLQARGPALDSTLISHFAEPAKADALLIQKVGETNVRYQEAVKLQEHLSKDVEEKGHRLKSLEDDLTKTKEETSKAMEVLAKNHEAALAKALANQQAKEAERWSKMQEEMEHKLKTAQQTLEQEQEARRYELEMAKADAEQRLSAEVSAREERMLKEQQAYHTQLAAIQAKADKKTQSEMSKAEEERKAAQETLEAEMQQRLAESEAKLQAEIIKREEELLQSKREMEEELLQSQRLVEAKEKDRQELQERIAESEARWRSPCSDMCCMM